MSKYNTAKTLRFPFLLSLILHGVMLIILGYMLIDSEQQKIRESVAVDMVRTMREKTPPLPRRVTQVRQSDITLKKIDDPLAKVNLEPKALKSPSLRIQQSINSPALNPLAPALGTSAKGFESRFEMPLPSANARGATITKGESGTGKSNIQREGGSIGLTAGASIFEVALHGIAKSIISKNKTGKEDIVFLIDASGSMEENISAVARYIVRMLEVFQDSKIDYTLGIVKFNRILKNNDIIVYEQTKDVNKFKSILRSIKCIGDESIFDAFDEGFAKVKFRSPVDKTFILVTDEPIRARPRQGGTPQGMTRRDLLQNDLHELIQRANANEVKINSIAIDDDIHKTLVKDTNGVWFPIPQPSD